MHCVASEPASLPLCTTPPIGMGGPMSVYDEEKLDWLRPSGSAHDP